MDMGGRRIPEDVMVEILKRLPVKSLLRFKSTSKEWCAVIKSPNFIKSHLRFSPKSNNAGGDGFLFDFWEKGSPNEDPIPFHTRFMMLWPDDDDDLINGLAPVKLNTDYLDSIIDFEGVSLHGCCDGILCLSEYSREECDYPFPIILWNPATRQFKSLPTPTHITIPDENAYSVLSTWEVAFGFDAKNDDYKVVAFISIFCRNKIILPTEDITGSTHHHYTEVYSLKSNSWRLVDPVIPLNSTHSLVTKCFFNAHGFLHRVVSFYNDDHAYNALLSLDMEDWVYRVTSAPPSQCINSGRLYGVVLSSSSDTRSKNIVAMYYIDYGDIEVWELNDFQCRVGKGVDDDCNHWTLKYKFFEPRDGIFRPLCLWRSCLLLMKSNRDVYSLEEAENYVYSEDEDEEEEFVSLCLYDRRTEITKSINCEFLSRYDQMCSTFYKETLTSLT